MFLFIPCYFIRLISLLEIGQRHEENLFNLRKQKDLQSFNDGEKQSKNIIHDFSSYSLTREEALSYGIDQHIPNYTDRNTVNIESELFFQNVLNEISNIPEETIINIKITFLL